MKQLFFLFCVLLSTTLYSQTEDAWLFLKDKPNAADYISNPLSMLSQRALDRRSRQNIIVDETDVPIDITYYTSIKNDKNLTILGSSKWMNAIHVQGIEINIKKALQDYNFIDRIEFANQFLNTSSKKSGIKISNKSNDKWKVQTEFNYGTTQNQIEMIGVDYLHEQNYTGNSMQIAVIDSGFPDVNTLDAFSRLRTNNQILGGYNFADRTNDFYVRNNHGSLVLSTIGGYLEDEFVGTAPDAKFYLFITEIVESETVLEETLWVEAAEKADSLGVDIINTSLGYTTFDNPNHSYSYSDMNGKTTFISRGAEIGASKGMILVVSAGNSGTNNWKYIGAPADSEGVFSIGAVDANRNLASFSSFGPTSDNRIKPNVLAQGQLAAVINNSNGNTVEANGTSFSAPILAGAIACFWEAFPDKSNFEIMQMIQETGDTFSNPTTQGGFGIPNFEIAFDNTLSIKNSIFTNQTVFPNPAKDVLFIDDNAAIKRYSIIDAVGKVIQFEALNSNQISISNLTKGIYFLRLMTNKLGQTIKFIKL